MSVNGRRFITAAEYEYREIEFDENDQPIVAERIVERQADLSDPFAVNPSVICLADSI